MKKQIAITTLAVTLLALPSCEKSPVKAKKTDKNQVVQADNANKPQQVTPQKDTPNMADTTPTLVQVSKKAPAITLKDQDGKTHKLSDYTGKWLVLYFYPKDDTPGCTTQACNFRDDLPDFTKLNASILGVSPDSEESHTKFIGNQKLTFSLLADVDKKVSTQYGVWQEKKNFGNTYMGIARTTYLIDPQGKVAFRWDNVKVKNHSQEVQDKINELKG